MSKILKFSASWCQPCKMLSRNLETAGIQVEEVDIDEKEDLAIQFGIRGVPTLVHVNEFGGEIKRLVGVKTPDELKAWAVQ